MQAVVENKEIIWTINKSVVQNQAKAVKNGSKEPVLIKELIDKAFQKLSVQMIEKISQLEAELSQLKNENIELKSRLTSLSKVA